MRWSECRVEEGDLEGVLGDGATLPDELVEPLLGRGAVALVVDVGAVRGARRLPVDADAEADGGTPRCRSHDQMQLLTFEHDLDGTYARAVAVPME
jgi:hypothetical protein